MKKNIVFILFVLFFQTFTTKFCFAEKQIQNINLNMNESVQMAYKHKPSIKAYQYAIQANKASEKVAMSGYLPQISINENPYVSSGSNGIQNNISVNAKQLVYSFAGPLEKYKIAQKGTEESEFAEEREKDYVRFFVESSFLSAWFQQRRNKLIQSLNQSATQTLKKAEHQNKLDLLGKNDWLIDASDYAANMSTVYSYDDDLDNAQSQLEFWIGKPFKDDNQTITLAWKSKQNIDLQPLNNYIAKALKNRKEIKIKQKEIEKQKETESYYKRTYLPSFNLTGRSARNSTAGNHIVGASLEWNIFDGASNYQESNKAHANMLKAMQEKESYVLQAKYDVQKSYYDLSQLLKQLVAQNIKLTQAKNEFVLKKQKYEIGDISKVALEASKYNWENQKIAWLTLKVNAATKERELIFACGYPED